MSGAMVINTKYRKILSIVRIIILHRSLYFSPQKQPNFCFSQKGRFNRQQIIQYKCEDGWMSKNQLLYSQAESFYLPASAITGCFKFWYTWIKAKWHVLNPLVDTETWSKTVNRRLIMSWAFAQGLFRLGNWELLKKNSSQ